MTVLEVVELVRLGLDIFLLVTLIFVAEIASETMTVAKGYLNIKLNMTGKNDTRL